jgi:hypothetical protein
MWFQVSFLGNPWQENPNGLVPGHMERRERNLPVGTQIQSLRMLSPLDGAPDALAVVHHLFHFVPRSGRSRRGSNLTSWFCLLALSFGGP